MHKKVDGCFLKINQHDKYTYKRKNQDVSSKIELFRCNTTAGGCPSLCVCARGAVRACA